MFRVVRIALLACLGAMLALPADITGTIIVQRKLTKRKVTAGAPLYSRGTAVGLEPDQGDPLAYERSHVVVYLEGPIPTGSKGMSASLEMAQDHRRFVPDLLVVPVGSMVSFPNFDPIFHNVFSLSKSKAFDLGNYPKGQTRTVTFSHSGIVFVNCHLHPNMAAAILVAPSPWATKAEGDGKFELTDVPPGKYTVVAWHKTAGYFRKVVEVTEGRNSHVEFFVPLAEQQPAPQATAQR